MRIRIIILFIIAGLTNSHSFAQDRNSIQATVDKNTILIGEPLQLTVKAFIAAGTAPVFPVVDTIDHFEFLEKPKTDSVRGKGGMTIEHVYTITSFDSGQWIIPSFVLARQQSEAIPVNVTFTPFDPNQDYHDIKDIIQVKKKKKAFPWWWYAGGTVLVVGIIAWLARRKKPIPKIVPVVAIDPYKEAITALQNLNAERSDPKLFYTGLVDIFRQYVYRAKGIHSQQKTTDDLVVQLREQQLPGELFTLLAHALRTGDFVKFAKYKPTPEEALEHYDAIRSTIDRLEQTRAAGSTDRKQ